MVNQLLGPLAPDPSWLVNSSLAMPVIAVFVTWKQLGLSILLYLAALQNVPKELYESAAVDGAGRLESFWHVTIPGVRPATTLVVILATITGANLFTEPYLLTNGGGPDGASASPVLVMYQKGIEQGHPDVAAAIGVILVIAVLALALGSRSSWRGTDMAPWSGALLLSSARWCSSFPSTTCWWARSRRSRTPRWRGVPDRRLTLTTTPRSTPG